MARTLGPASGFDDTSTDSTTSSDRSSDLSPIDIPDSVQDDSGSQPPAQGGNTSDPSPDDGGGGGDSRTVDRSSDPSPINIPDSVSGGSGGGDSTSGTGSDSGGSNESQPPAQGGNTGDPSSGGNFTDSGDTGGGGTGGGGIDFSEQAPTEAEMTTGPAPGDTGQNNARIRAAAAEQVQDRFAADLSRGEDFNIAVSNDDQPSLRLTEQGRQRLAESQQDFQAGIAAAAEGITDNQMQISAEDFLPGQFEEVRRQVEEQNPGAEAGEDFTVSINDEGEFTATATDQPTTTDGPPDGNEGGAGEPTTVDDVVTTGADTETVAAPSEFGANQPTVESDQPTRTTSQNGLDASDAGAGAGGAIQTAGEVFDVAAGVGDFLAGDIDEAIGRRTSEATIDADVADEFTDGGLLNAREGEGDSVISQVTGVTEADLQDVSEDFRTINEQFTVDLQVLQAGGTPVTTVPLLVEEENPQSDSPSEVVQETALDTVANVGAAGQGVEDIAEIVDPRNLPMVFREPGTVATSGAAAVDDQVTATERFGRENPLKFATASTIGVAGVAAGGVSAARSAGAASGLKAAIKTEVDPRIGPFGTTAETKLTRRIRNAVDDFQSDQRGQAQLVGGLDSDSLDDGGTTVDLDSNSGDVEPSTDFELEGGVQEQARRDLAEQFEVDIENTRGTFERDRDPFGRSDGPAFDPESDVPDAEDVFDFDSTTDGDVDINDVPGVRDQVDGADAVGVTVGPAAADRAATVASSGVDERDVVGERTGGDVSPDVAGDLDTGIDTTVDVDQGLDTRSDVGTDFDRGFDFENDVDTNDPGSTDFDFTDTDTRDRDRDPADQDPNPRDVDVAFDEQRVDDNDVLEEVITIEEDRFDTGFFAGDDEDESSDALAGLDEFL